MRRFLLTLTAFSISAWSQPAQQQPQLPPVVKVEMPPTNSWVHIAELVVPGIIGAGLALFGVWLTNKNNAATNAANREHELKIEIAKAEIASKYKSQDNRWAFRKDVYVNILTACDALVQSIIVVAETQRTINSKSQGYESLLPMQQENASILRRAQGEFSKYALLAPLAMADDVNPLVEIALKQLAGGRLEDPNASEALTSKAMTLMRLSTALQAAGRKDLWGTSEMEGKAEGAIQP